MTDDRHLQFLPHMADAVADLAKGTVVYDVVGEVLYTAQEFHAILARELRSTGFDAHVRIVWHKDLHSGHAETKGLVKKGLPELSTDEAHLDQQVLVCEVVAEAAKKIWEAREIPEKIEVSAYEDSYRTEITATKSGPYRVRVLRLMRP